MGPGILLSIFILEIPWAVGMFSRVITTYLLCNPNSSICFIPLTPSEFVTSTVLVSSKLSESVQHAAFLNSSSPKISFIPIPFPSKRALLFELISMVLIRATAESDSAVAESDLLCAKENCRKLI